MRHWHVSNDLDHFRPKTFGFLEHRRELKFLLMRLISRCDFVWNYSGRGVKNPFGSFWRGLGILSLWTRVLSPRFLATELCSKVAEPPPSPRGGTPRKIGWGVCRPLLRTLTLFMTKICDILYPIYDLTKNSKPYLWPDPYIKILFQTCIIISSLVQTNVKLP